MPTYYMQVKQAVLPRLEFYKDDLLKLDRDKLRTYTGAFIHSSRDCGTDLFQLDDITSVLSFDAATVFTLRSNNDLFLYGVNGKVNPITRKEALKIVLRNIPQIARQIAKHNGIKPVNGDLDAACRNTRIELIGVFDRAINNDKNRIH